MPDWSTIITLDVGFIFNEMGQASKRGLTAIIILGGVTGLLLFGFFML